MTAVEFHTGVSDPIGFACRLLRKACRQRVRVLVTAPAGVLTELDRAMWVFEERDFLPHVCMPATSAAIAARTPVWLATNGSIEGAPRLLVNLGADAPTDLGRVDRLIEIVSAEPDDAERGRDRWRGYAGAGLSLKHHRSSQAGDG